MVYSASIEDWAFLGNLKLFLVHHMNFQRFSVDDVILGITIRKCFVIGQTSI